METSLACAVAARMIARSRIFGGPIFGDLIVADEACSYMCQELVSHVVERTLV